ncbi:MAG TPA: acyloxyacyl hydrolase [Balneolaceae bacterium]|nr:acyloxyacyl hydrolase [Balneolaceae bacterium]
MKFLFTIILCFTALSCNAQVFELGYGPVSDKGVGSLPNTSKVNFSFLFKAYQSSSFYYLPGIRYSFVDSKNKDIVDNTGKNINGAFNMFFIIPVSFNVPLGKFAYINRMGFGLSGKSFPNNDGRYQNFLLEVGFRYAITPDVSVSLRYSHISNGWRGRINPGVDNIMISTGFYL